MLKKGVTIIELLVVAGIFLAMIACLAPFVNMVKVRSQRIDCANNLRKLSLGLHSYALGHKGAFPASLGELYPNYADDRNAFDCPASKTMGTKDKPDYSYKAGLTESSDPREAIAEDLDGNHRKAGRNILRLNGAVEWVRARR
ncbi:MAG: type II secretion system protein [Candidatus Omnitrophica bacterium]|nr:type II secretion system protein [Candidatus Omnitrophota bacterium]